MAQVRDKVDMSSFGLLRAGDLVGMRIGLNVDQKRHGVFILAVVVVPLLQLAQSLYALSRLPAFWRFYADPPYMYLFNSLSLGTGLTPQHVDHPGTSLQWLMAGIERVTFLANGTQDSLASDIAWHPEKYLTSTGVVLAVLFALSVAYFLLQVLRHLGSLPAVVSGILVLAASGLTVPWMVTATPEALVASCAMVILGLLMPSLTDRSTQLSWRPLVVVGLLLAVGVTAKIIILPVVLLLIFVLRLRGLVIVAATTGAATAVILIPVYELLPRMFGWFTNLARSSGRYGGESPSSVTSNVQAGLSTVTSNYGLTWLVMVIFVVLLVLSVRNRWIGIGWSQRLPAIGVAATAMATVAVSFKESTDRDFMLLVGLVPTLGAINAAWIQRIGAGLPVGKERLIRSLGTVGILVLIALAVVSNYRSFSEIGDIKQRSDREVAVLNEAADQDGVIAHAFLAQNEYFALMLGSEWAYHPYSEEIIQRFPDNLYFNSFLSTVFGKRLDGSVGYLDCRDLTPLVEGDGLTFVLPGDFTFGGDRETPGAISLADGSVLTYNPNVVTLFGDRLSSVPINGCLSPP